MEPEHRTVLLHEAVESLNLKSGDFGIDATLGLGGHTQLMARLVATPNHILGIDKDSGAVSRAVQRLERDGMRIHTAVGNYTNLDVYAQHVAFSTVQGILFDLGWNTTQHTSNRGFSFNAHEPLIMTYEVSPLSDSLTAAQVVNTWSEKDLAEVIKTLGEEPFADRIARSIVESRSQHPIEYADQLRDLVEAATPQWYRRKRVHAATKTFQALRMLVNNELSGLTEALEKAYTLLTKNGRLSVISFHSLEDGLVKRTFRRWAQENKAKLIHKKPLTPSREETKNNPRSRSAKLRTIEKI